MKTSDWIAAYPVRALTLTGECELQEAARMLLDNPERRDIFVLDAEGRVCGHLGFWHVSSLLLVALRPTHSLRELVERITLGSVAEHMNDRVMCAEADEEINDILYRHDLFQKHIERRVEDIPVVDEQRRLLGVIRLSDLLRHTLGAQEGIQNTR
ncbi:CBS domain-containing protein [Halomonas piscis]|uniref:CBS domain-containing protein n=1 Tax=Halomonas piscis TaxID=3031727 RepID=UPI00289BA126|nr:CBS domain-containing protein [Halomonas piscis]